MTDPQQCPTSAAIQALIEGGLNPADELNIVEHLEYCANCRNRLEKHSSTSVDFADQVRMALTNETAAPTAALMEVIAHAEADIREIPLEGSLDSRLGQNNTPPDYETLVDPQQQFESATFTPNRGYADVQKWLEPSDDSESIGKLGGFRLTEFIGRGGMGVVFRAEDVKLKRDVAIKILSPELLADEDSHKRFLREARAIAALNHINIVTIHSVDDDSELPYFVMEFVPGHSLRTHLDRRGTLTDAEVIKIARQISRGLEAAHAKGIIHRDIKPSNILIDKKSKRAKLTDFGLARAGSDNTLTDSGACVGTPAFLAPELFENAEPSVQTDLFSVGVTLYTAGTGRLPFEGPLPLVTIQRIAKGEFDPVRQVAPDVSENVAVVIEKLLSRDPKQRFTSARELDQCLKQIGGQTSLAEVTPNSLAEHKFGWGQHAAVKRPIVLIGASVLLTMVAVLVWVSGLGDSGDERLSQNQARNDASESQRDVDARELDAGRSDGRLRPSAKDSIHVISERLGESEFFDSLAEAVEQAPDGATIQLVKTREYHVSETIGLDGKSITIESADDAKPIIVSHDFPLIQANADLTVSGLDIQFDDGAFDEEELHDRVGIEFEQARVRFFRCRIRLADPGVILALTDAHAVFLECELYAPHGLVCQVFAEEGDRASRLDVSGCLSQSSVFLSARWLNEIARVDLSDNVIAAQSTIQLNELADEDEVRPCVFQCESNVFLCSDSLIQFVPDEPEHENERDAKFDTWISRMIIDDQQIGRLEWRGKNNTLPEVLVSVMKEEDEFEETIRLGDLRLWNSLDRVAERGMTPSADVVEERYDNLHFDEFLGDPKSLRESLNEFEPDEELQHCAQVIKQVLNRAGPDGNR